MKNISEYSNLIKEIPAEKQSAKIKRIIWERILTNANKLINDIFGGNDEIELSRKDILSETDVSKKIVKVLMWGYPTGGRGNNIKNVIEKIEELIELLSKTESKNLSKDCAYKLFDNFKRIKGLGMSTWSKLLYFFEVYIDSNKCQIYDIKIVNSLNRKQFIELDENKKWEQENDDYCEYIGLVNFLSVEMGVSPEQIEIFLFHYNLYYKFISD